MKESEMRQIGAWLDTVVANVDDDGMIARIAGEVREFGRQFPAPGLP
jgi:glycine/serine hydroxymethyltransferase